ncbi:hypothetical protein [Streptomyces sp. MZ04]|uniref:hypothetical protein n=1 Tax=Streptomyces sp. MZ04 TaxID=2559236 RepID=UPI00107EE256|nr:hypothetical protein [Streptomyces sp. MZ04]TGB13763.1 hypothetical protein E2651_08115 [Streptomyces sp. MZ04]
MKVIQKTVLGVAGLALLGGAAPAYAAGSQQVQDVQVQAAPKYKILKNLSYSGPGNMPLRLGYYNKSKDAGFGWTKIKNKHNITKYSAVQALTKSPNRKKVPKSKASYSLTAYAGKYKCSRGVCRLVKQYKVTATVNEEHKGGSKYKFGVVTEHIIGPERAPNWVTKSLVKLNKKGGRAATAQKVNGESLVGSYKPLTKTVKANKAAAADLDYRGSYKLMK